MLGPGLANLLLFHIKSFCVLRRREPRWAESYTPLGPPSLPHRGRTFSLIVLLRVTSPLPITRPWNRVERADSARIPSGNRRSGDAGRFRCRGGGPSWSPGASRGDDAGRRVLPHVCCRSPGACWAAAAALPRGRSCWQPRFGNLGGPGALSAKPGALVAAVVEGLWPWSTFRWRWRPRRCV